MNPSSKRSPAVTVLLLSIALGVPPGASAQEARAAPEAADRAREVVARLEKVMFPDARAVATLRFQSGQRVEKYEMVYFTRDRNQKIIVRMTAPASSVGNDILMVDQNVWTYDQAANRVMKVASNQSFGGTGFSYGDVVRLNLSDHYDPALKEEGPEQVTLELTARTRSAPYYRIGLTVDRRGGWPLRGTYFARNGSVVKEIVYSDLRELGTGRRPVTLTVTSPLDPGAVNVLTVVSEGPKVLPDRIFNKRNLEARLEEKP